MLEILQVETTSHCNARCIFCAHDQMDEYGTMPDSLYSRILAGAARLDPPPAPFIPMLTGEPFLAPQIVQRIVEARQFLQYCLICLKEKRGEFL